jgi:endonuclease/exonuclease/phosphatase family metal-dependent hydrolase
VVRTSATVLTSVVDPAFSHGGPDLEQMLIATEISAFASPTPRPWRSSPPPRATWSPRRDYVIHTGGVHTDGVGVLRPLRARLASDHLPVAADLTAVTGAG